MPAAPGVVLEGNTLLVTGEVDALNAPALRRQGAELIATAPGSGLTVDLAGLATASSVLLSLLLCWQRAGVARDLSLSFTGASADLAELARLNGVAAVLPGFKTPGQTAP